MENNNPQPPPTGYVLPPAQGAPVTPATPPGPPVQGAPPVHPVQEMPSAAPGTAEGAPLGHPAEPNDPHRVIQTDHGAKDGLAKCARCGATDISLNVATGNLCCGYCRFEWSAQNAIEAFNLDGDISKLSGLVMGSGSADIVPSTDDILTFKCSACGADVVIDSRATTQARCHWCRNTLSMNQQIPNGAIPDMILPIRMPKATAVEKITHFVKKRQFFAHPKFRAEFNAENVMGVYLPYMVVDVNAHARLDGHGEHQTRSYSVKHGDKDETRYDADLYNVGRDFDIHVNDLTVESSSERLDQNTSRNSNNIINSIMPFDVENAVRYDANYLKGFTSERRDSNFDQISPIARTQVEDITRHRVNDTLGFYDRGVRWTQEQVDVRGQRWVSAYLPVWLYSYQERKSNGKTFLHYVAVNARTGETMGSVPLNQRKLLLVAGAVQLVGTVVGLVLVVLGI